MSLTNLSDDLDTESLGILDHLRFARRVQHALAHGTAVEGHRVNKHCNIYNHQVMYMYLCIDNISQNKGVETPMHNYTLTYAFHVVAFVRVFVAEKVVARLVRRDAVREVSRADRVVRGEVHSLVLHVQFLAAEFLNTAFK